VISIFDVILLILLSGFIFYGFFFGLIRTIGSLVGVIAAAFLASRFYLEFFGYFVKFFFGYNNLGKVLSFLILFSLITKVVSFLFSLLDKVFGLLSIIPFLKTINRLAGAIFGFIEGALALGLILYVSSRYALINTLFGSWMANSQLAPFFLKVANLITPLLPEVLKKLQSLI